MEGSINDNTNMAPRIENLQIVDIDFENRQQQQRRQQRQRSSSSLNNNSTISGSTSSTRSSVSSKVAKLGAGALAWTAVKVVRTTAVAIFGLGVGVGLILGDSLRSHEAAGTNESNSNDNTNVVSGDQGRRQQQQSMALPYHENSLPAQ